jgi:hypothetical protein
MRAAGCDSTCGDVLDWKEMRPHHWIVASAHQTVERGAHANTLSCVWYETIFRVAVSAFCQRRIAVSDAYCVQYSCRSRCNVEG